MPLQDEMAALSTRGVHTVLPDATHASLIEDERDAIVSSQAILNVVEAVRGADLIDHRIGPKLITVPTNNF